jgi:uncharacterized protein
VPANLSPEYIKTEREYRAAKSPDEKLVLLQRMLKVIPKHKGTDHLQGDIKKRIARLRERIETQTKKKGPSYRVKPDGAGQIMLVGPPNSGKSSLLDALTHAQPDIADYPCTTREPMPGMVLFESVQVQLVDLPPVWKEHCESFVFDNIRACNGVLVVLDLTAPDPIEELAETFELLRGRHLEFLPTTDERIERDPNAGVIEYELVMNKADLDADGELLALIREMMESSVPMRVVSARTGQGLEDLRRRIYRMLHVIRVFSKDHGKDPDLDAPFTVPVGATVLDFAAAVHRDFADHFKSARVWGSSKFDGQVVQRDHVLADGDIVELTMTNQ